MKFFNIFKLTNVSVSNDHILDLLCLISREVRSSVVVSSDRRRVPANRDHREF
jgi:hypothetical protein